MRSQWKRRPWVPAVGAVTAAVLAVGPLTASADPTPEEAAPERASSLVPPAQPEPEPARGDDEPGLVILQMAGEPVAGYDGGVPGYAATKSASGDRLDPGSPAASRYESYLLAQQEDALAEVGLGQDDLVDQFTTAFNGVAVEATPAQVRDLVLAGAVTGSWENETLYTQTISTPEELGLAGPDGAWEEWFGGADDAGAGVIVGVIDSGIVPENPSFAPRPGMSVPERWRGTCETSEGPTGFACNTKIIGARTYGEAYGNLLPSNEVPTPRDVNGHGSHTAGTAAGNADIPMAVDGVDVGVGSGIAPGAQIAVYKAAWGAEGGGTLAGIVAAIDDATADGVDVINFSIGASITEQVSPHGLALLGAAEAGVFVSAAAGNAGGGGEGTVENAYPWITTVGATTTARPSVKTLTFGDRTLQGNGFGEGVSGPVITGFRALVPGRQVDLIDGCAPGTLVEDLVRGSVMVCEDQGNPFVVSEYLTDLGAVGVVFFKSRGAGLPGYAIGYPGIPAIGLSSSSAGQFYSWANANTGAEVEISAVSETPAVSPELAWFSSLGPSRINKGALIKPDVVAPGVDIVAPFAPGPDDFLGISGTSMAAPHVAGLGALLRSANPDWSPARIRSALVTTAQNANTEGGPIERVGTAQTSDGVGAGMVRPAAAFDPGLVYEASSEDWQQYLCVTRPVPGSDCPAVPAPVSDLNEPAIAVRGLGLERVVPRTVTDATGEGGTWTAEVEHDEQIDVTVEPSTLTLEPGGSASFEVTITSLDRGDFLEPRRGTLTWVNGDTRVSSPIVAETSTLDLPEVVNGQDTTGSVTYPVGVGVDGSYETNTSPLVPIRKSNAGNGIVEYDFTNTRGPAYARFETRAEDYPAGVDIDLLLVVSDGLNLEFVAASQTRGSDEVIIAPGLRSDRAYTLVVVSDTPSIGRDRPFYEAVVTAPPALGEPDPPEDGDAEMAVSPETFDAAAGDSVDLTVSWEDLEPEQEYVGVVQAFTRRPLIADGTLITVGTRADWSAQAERWAGADRYETAALISEKFPDRVDTVYVAAGDGYADALASGPAAGRGLIPGIRQGGNSAPLLLVKPDGIPKDTVSALERLDPSRVVLLGGRTRVGDGVLEELEAMIGDGRVQRVEGRDRYGTAAALAQAFDPDRRRVYVARGDAGGLADALSAGALAGAENAPVVLVQEGRVPRDTAAALDHLNPVEIVIVGGEESIEEDVERELAEWGRVSRVGGADRYGTSAALAAQFDERPDRAYVARGDEFVDALAISSLAGGQRQPILLTQPTTLPRVIPPAIAALEPGTITAVGGETAISRAVLELLGDPGTYLPGD